MTPEAATKSGIGGDSTSEPVLMVGIEVDVGDRDADCIVVGFEVVGGMVVSALMLTT